MAAQLIVQENLGSSAHPQEWCVVFDEKPDAMVANVALCIAHGRDDRVQHESMVERLQEQGVGCASVPIRSIEGMPLGYYEKMIQISLQPANTPEEQKRIVAEALRHVREALDQYAHIKGSHYLRDQYKSETDMFVASVGESIDRAYQGEVAPTAPSRFAPGGSYAESASLKKSPPARG